jgi:hypothetical protein
LVPAYFVEPDDRKIGVLIKKLADAIEALEADLSHCEADCAHRTQRAEAAEAEQQAAIENEGEANSLLETLYDACKQYMGDDWPGGGGVMKEVAVFLDVWERRR